MCIDSHNGLLFCRHSDELWELNQFMMTCDRAFVESKVGINNYIYFNESWKNIAKSFGGEILFAGSKVTCRL